MYLAKSDTSGLNASQLIELDFIRNLEINWDGFYEANKIIDVIDEPALFFVLNARKLNLVIPNTFDVGFYLKENPDVRSILMNPLVHYVNYGFNEGRDPFSASLVQDKIQKTEKVEAIENNDNQIYPYEVATLETADINWVPYLAYFQLNDKQEAIYHYLENWRESNHIFDDWFDANFYLSEYPDVEQSKFTPLVHFMSAGKSEGRFAKSLYKNREAVALDSLNPTQSHEYYSLKKLNLNWESYYEFNSIGLPDRLNDPVLHYILEWRFQSLDLPGFFITDLYIEQYPDIKESGVNPLYHFALHGKSEGRVGFFDFQDHIEQGKLSFNSELETIIVVCHESSATGAPLVGFNISNQFRNNFNIVNVVMKERQLQASFLNCCFLMVKNIPSYGSVIPKLMLTNLLKNIDVSAIICNSAETFPVLQAANELDIPTVSLVHEYSEYYWKGRILHTSYFADRVIVPAQTIMNSMIREYRELDKVFVLPNHIRIRPQGRLPFIPEGHGTLDSVKELKRAIGVKDNETVKIVLGAGYVQIRKGVDLFLMTAKYVKEKYKGKVKFVWVGAGYEPDTDFAYSNWLQTQISKSGLDEDIVFLSHQRNLNNIFKITDVFCLTSRLDPFPNVVIDALAANIHVTCFEESTGCAEFLIKHDANAAVVPYLDVYEMANAICGQFQVSDKTERNSEIVENELNFDSYLDYLKVIVEEAKEFRKSVISQKEVIRNSKKFDAEYFGMGKTHEIALNNYVQLSLKGIHLFNPCPGFSEKQWILENGSNNQYQVPLFESLLNNKQPKTHDCQLVNDLFSREIDFKYAVHLHLYYYDLAQDFINYFKHLPGDWDLYITHCGNVASKDLKEQFSDCGFKEIFAKKVNNIGRDIAPLFQGLKRQILSKNYEVVGHFHSKKSNEVKIAEGPSLGDAWRDYLLQSLIGTKEEASKILSLFNEKDVGLIFSEDHHCVDIGQNRDFIEVLCKNMEISVPLDTHVFPLGTMFWARIESLKPLFELKWLDYTVEEPLPYDGSYLHSIERILPEVIKSRGFCFKTVYKNGTNW